MSKRKQLKALRILALDLLVQRVKIADDIQQATDQRDWPEVDMFTRHLERIDLNIVKLVNRHYRLAGNR